MDTAAIKNYMNRVDLEFERTSTQISDHWAKALLGQANPLPYGVQEWAWENAKWKQFLAENIDDLWIDDDVYNETIAWHSRLAAWQNPLTPEEKSKIQGTRPRDPVTDPELPDIGSSITTGVVVVGALGVLALLLSRKDR